jgi:putative transposase
VKARRRRQRVPPHVSRPGRYDKPNATWCADFKGWFRTRDGTRCDPLTISDGHSRFILACRIVERPTFEYGPPFASTGLGGLSRLAIWWLKLGITPDRIEPGKPEQNGRHERFHKTLKAETASPPAATPRSQQRRFDRFTLEYNEDRPHEALADDTPASHYSPSPRSYPRALPQIEYPAGQLVRSIRSNGNFKWHGRLIFVSETLVGERIGLEPIDNDQWLVRFATLRLAVLDHRPREPILRRI